MVYIYIYILEPYIVQERTKIIATLSLNLLNAILIICTVVTAIGILGRVASIDIRELCSLSCALLTSCMIIFVLALLQFMGASFIRPLLSLLPHNLAISLMAKDRFSELFHLGFMKPCPLACSSLECMLKQSQLGDSVDIRWSSKQNLFWPSNQFNTVTYHDALLIILIVHACTFDMCYCLWITIKNS